MSKRVLYIMVIAAMMLTACNNSAPKNSKTKANNESYAGPEYVEGYEPGRGNAKEASYIVVNKGALTLKLYDKSDDLICSFPVAVGKGLGDKTKDLDMKTPEGEFSISRIEDATSWNIHEGNNGYGSWFIRLDVQKGGENLVAGICGTQKPELVGLRSSLGNIVLRNEDIDSLYNMINANSINIRVIIKPGNSDLRADGKLVEQKNAPVEQNAEEETKAEPTEEKSAKKEEKRENNAVTDSNGDVWHTIAKGEYISTIANKYGTTTQKIKKLNPDINIDRIRVGQRIRVYGAEEVTSTSDNAKAQSATTPGEVYHKVAKGEYASKIASKYGITIKKLKELNPGLNPDKIREGQKIRVR